MAGSLSLSQLTIAGSVDGTELMLVSKPSATVTITAITISAQASDNSFNDSGAGFVAAGFVAGMRVKVEGFTGDPANNILSGVLTDVTAAKLTLGGTDGDVIVDDAAGESVTVTAWESEAVLVRTTVGLATPEVIAEATAATTLDPLKNGKYVRYTNAAAKTLTVQPNATEALPDNGEWHIRNVGAADLTIVAGSGVTITPPASGTLVVQQNATVTLKRVAVDTFDLLGQTVAA